MCFDVASLSKNVLNARVNLSYTHSQENKTVTQPSLEVVFHYKLQCNVSGVSPAPGQWCVRISLDIVPTMGVWLQSHATYYIHCITVCFGAQKKLHGRNRLRLTTKRCRFQSHKVSMSWAQATSHADTAMFLIDTLEVGKKDTTSSFGLQSFNKLVFHPANS